MAAPPSAEPGSGAPYLPFAGGAYRLALGLRALAEPHWLEPDGDLAADLAAKRALLAERHGEVFAALPESLAPAGELLALLGRHLPLHHAAIFSRAGDRLANRATGESWDLAAPALHPLDLAGRLVQEDFCLLAASGDGPYRLIGATLCAPSRWRLADKLGRPLDAIHAPVPGYGAALARPVDRFFAHVRPGRLAWRLNWSIHDRPTRFQPERPADQEPIAAADAGRRLWLRVERQSFRRLAESGAVVFAIRTHLTRLDAAVRDRRTAAELKSALDSMPAETQRYKDLAVHAAALLAWLDRVD